MTQPPQQPAPFGQDPYGQQGQPGPQQPGQPEQFGQPQHPGGYPQPGPGPQQGWGTPAQGFNPGQGFSPQQPYGQWDGNQGMHQGYPGQQPPPKKTGLIVGLVVLGVLIVGGVVALILVLTNKDDNSAAGGPPASSKASASGKPSSRISSRPSIPSSSSSGGTGGSGTIQPSPEALASFLAQAYNTTDQQSVISSFCSPTEGASSQNLPLPGTQATVLPPAIQGSSGQVNLAFVYTKSDGSQGRGTMVFDVKQANGGWCVADINGLQPN